MRPALLPGCTFVHLTPFTYPTVHGPLIDGNDRRRGEGENIYIGFSMPKVSFDSIDETQDHPRASNNFFLRPCQMMAVVRLCKVGFNITFLQIFFKSNEIH